MALLTETTSVES